MGICVDPPLPATVAVPSAAWVRRGRDRRETRLRGFVVVDGREVERGAGHGGRCPLCGTVVPDPVEPTPEHLRRWLGEGVCRRLGLVPIPADLSVSVVIPVYNERATVREIVRRVQAVPISKEVLIVDDGSTDGTS